MFMENNIQLLIVQFFKMVIILDDKIKIFNYLDYKVLFKFFKEKVETIQC